MLNNCLYISRTLSECDYIRLVAFLFTTQQVVCQLAEKEIIFTVSEKIVATAKEVGVPLIQYKVLRVLVVFHHERGWLFWITRILSPLPFF